MAMNRSLKYTLNDAVKDKCTLIQTCIPVKSDVNTPEF